jgi:hypothetical protein
MSSHWPKMHYRADGTYKVFARPEDVSEGWMTYEAFHALPKPELPEVAEAIDDKDRKALRDALLATALDIPADLSLEQAATFAIGELLAANERLSVEIEAGVAEIVAMRQDLDARDDKIATLSAEIAKVDPDGDQKVGGAPVVPPSDPERDALIAELKARGVKVHPATSTEKLRAKLEQGT